MKTKERLIDANHFAIGVALYIASNAYLNDTALDALKKVSDWLDKEPTVDAVEVERFNALKSLVNGEWVDCKLVQEALGIDFATGLKMFKFSRTAEWNPAPLNGQKITTEFKLKNAADGKADAIAELVRCINCQSHEPCEVRNRVWCRQMGRYMKEDGFCSEGKVKE